MRLSPVLCFDHDRFISGTRVIPPNRGQSARRAATAAALGLAFLLASGAPGASASSAKSGVINAVGAENEYANVLSQIGGKYVKVSSILDNPNTDPHTFEASTSVAQEVSHAELIVQNGVGYDGFMNDIESASPNSSRKVIVAQHVLGLPDSTPNPHLWYSPKTMPAVAKVMATDLSRARAEPQGVLRGETAILRHVTQALAERHRRLQGAIRRHPGRHHRAGGRLSPHRHGHEEPHPVRRSRPTS